MKRKSNSRAAVRLAALAGALLLIGASLAVYLRVIKPWQMRQRYVLAYETTIAQQCAENQLDPYLVAAMIYCESTYYPGAVSGVGARGLMQIMPETADWLAWRMELADFNYDQLFDPETNIKMGCAYLAFLHQRYDGDMRCMVAAYHCGQGQLDRWLKDPAYSSDGKTLAALPENDTNKYLKWVLKVYEIYRELYPEAF